MIEKKVKVTNPQGIHMRPAKELAEAMSRYKSEVFMTVDEQEYDAKSMLRIMRAQVKCGTYVRISAEGHDEADAVEEAVSLIESGFSEI